jgi:hypothetical protein
MEVEEDCFPSGPWHHFASKGGQHEIGNATPITVSGNFRGGVIHGRREHSEFETIDSSLERGTGFSFSGMLRVSIRVHQQLSA